MTFAKKCHVGVPDFRRYGNESTFRRKWATHIKYLHKIIAYIGNSTFFSPSFHKNHHEQVTQHQFSAHEHQQVIQHQFSAHQKPS